MTITIQPKPIALKLIYNRNKKCQGWINTTDLKILIGISKAQNMNQYRLGREVELLRHSVQSFDIYSLL